MNIALLNTRITIQQQTVTTDSIGNHMNTWADYYSCYATVSAEGGKEMTDAGMVVDDSTADFTVRWCQQAAAVTPTVFRVKFGEDIFNIEAVDHMNFKHKAVKLRCRKVRR